MVRDRTIPPFFMLGVLNEGQVKKRRGLHFSAYFNVFMYFYNTLCTLSYDLNFAENTFLAKTKHKTLLLKKAYTSLTRATI